MSTRPDPERSGTVEVARPSSPVSVGLARAYPLTKTQAVEPSRQTRSSYGPPYRLGRWSSAVGRVHIVRIGYTEYSIGYTEYSIGCTEYSMGYRVHSRVECTIPGTL